MVYNGGRFTSAMVGLQVVYNGMFTSGLQVVCGVQWQVYKWLCAETSFNCLPCQQGVWQEEQRRSGLRFRARRGHKQSTKLLNLSG